MKWTPLPSAISIAPSIKREKDKSQNNPSINSAGMVGTLWLLVFYIQISLLTISRD